MKTTASLVAASLMAAAVAQSPTFRMDPAAQLGSGGATITFDLTASPGTVYSMLANLDGGPTDLFGERFYLGLSPTLVTLRAGVIPTQGIAAGSLTVPAFAGALGLAIFGQGAVLDSSAPNGLFRVTNAESSLTYNSPFALAVDFTDPAALGFTGTYSQSIPGHISGGPVTYRTHETIAPQAVFFPSPLQNPLNPNGCREQMVYRAIDLGATGQPELVTAIRWFSLTALQTDSLAQFELLVGHTPVVPDYTIDPFTALPVAPASGLAPTFAANYVPNAPPQTVFNGRYDITPGLRRPDGYVPLPMVTPFAYDGASSMLLEFKTGIDPQAIGINGLYGSLMVQSSPRPNARNTAGGTVSVPVNPNATSSGNGDNWMAQLQIEFARVETTAMSPWFDSGSPAPDYDAAYVAASLPPGTTVQLEYRGSASSTGTNPTAWSASPDIADGLQFLQFRMTFFADPVSGEVPVVDTLVVAFS